MSRQETRWAWLFLAPWVIGFLVFTGGPMIASLVLSFTEYDVISAPQFTGLDNYRQLMSDPAVAVGILFLFLIVTFIFEFRASWTDLMRPLIYLRDGSLFTLPRGLKVILDQFGQGGEGQWEVVLAASVIATLPMLVIFFIGQRYFVEGIATTGRKG
jgi:ABC-type sugar transport system permease subunit